MRLAGDYGPEAPPQLRAIVAVSPTMHLGMCVEALERRANRLYQWNFVRDLKRRMKRKARAWPGRFDLSRLGSVRTVRDFDERFTAPHHGFRDADDYYHRASSLRVVDRVSVPTLVVSADDDPFVPRAQFDDPGIAANRRITVQITPHGGHCGFYARASADFDGYWAERRVIGAVQGTGGDVGIPTAASLRFDRRSIPPGTPRGRPAGPGAARLRDGPPEAITPKRAALRRTAARTPVPSPCPRA